MDNAFALQSNKGAEEKERAEKAANLRKQQQYSKELIQEIEKRKQMREIQKQKGVIDLQREIDESNRVADKTAAQQA